MKIIKLPTELNLDWSNFDWKVTTGFSLVGNRYVDRQLYKEYEVESIEQAINNLGKNASVLVHYHFKPINFSTMFRIYAVANLFSNRCTYKEREMIEGETRPRLEPKERVLKVISWKLLGTCPPCSRASADESCEATLKKRKLRVSSSQVLMRTTSRG